ncbi:MAG: hypothetical protein LKE48_07770, partial [Solobacterium sp.]|nr:hypothetical protein [Solobacterium sp.]
MKRKVILTGLALSMLYGCGEAKTEPSADTTEVETANAEMQKKTCRKVDYYDYASPVPASAAADDAYFADTFFGGDSRMGSLALYSNLSDRGAEIYYGESLRLWSIEKMDIETGSGTDTMYNLMMNTSKNNIYLLLGINEIRSESFDDWAAYYEEVISALLEKKPGVN